MVSPGGQFYDQVESVFIIGGSSVYKVCVLICCNQFYICLLLTFSSNISGLCPTNIILTKIFFVKNLWCLFIIIYILYFVIQDALESLNPCRIYLTRVLADFECDTFLPKIDTSKFREIEK